MQKTKTAASMPPPTAGDRSPRFPEAEEPSKNPSETAASPEKEKTPAAEKGAISGRERLKRHRVDVAGRVWVPDTWGQEGLLKDWIDCAAFDASLVRSSIMTARDSLAEEGRRASSARLRLESS